MPFTPEELAAAYDEQVGVKKPTFTPEELSAAYDSSSAPTPQGGFWDEALSAKNLYGAGTNNWGTLGQAGEGLAAMGRAEGQYLAHPIDSTGKVIGGLYDEIANPNGQLETDLLSTVPGATTGAQYLGDKLYGVQRTPGDYGKMAQEDIAPGLAGLAIGGAGGEILKGVGRVGEAMSPALRGARQAGSVVNELRGVLGNPDFMTQPITRDALSTQISEGMGRNAEAARTAAGAQFDNALMGENYVDINPAVAQMKSQLASRQGILDPKSPSGSVISGLQEMTTPNGGPIAVSPNGTAVVPGTGVLPLDSFQNVLRDVGQGVDQSWAGGILKDTKASLLEGARKQLAPDKMEALDGARSSWQEMKQAYGEGAAETAQDIVNNPDARLDTLYNKLVQDSKSANQLVQAMTEVEREQSKALILQRMLEQSPTQWGSFITKRRPALAQLFSEPELADLTNWATGQTPGAGFVQQSPTVSPQKSFGRHLAETVGVGGAGMIGGPTGYAAATAGVAGIEGGIALKNALRGRTILEARQLLKQAAVGDPSAIATINGTNAATGGSGLSAQLTSLIGASGGQLTAALGGPQQSTPDKLPRDWGEIRESPELRKSYSAVLQATGMLPPGVGVENLSDADAKSSLSQMVQMIPQAFQTPAGGYQSNVNGVLYSPIDQDSHKRMALDAPAVDRAKIMSGLYDGNKYVPLNGLSPIVGSPQRQSSMDIGQLNSALDIAPQSPMQASSPDMTSMISRLEQMTNLHAKDVIH